MAMIMQDMQLLSSECTKMLGIPQMLLGTLRVLPTQIP